MTVTSASVRFSAKGVTGVESYLHLTGDTYIQCCTYDDQAPILAVHDAHVDVSITVPDRYQVTQDDVTFGRLLAEAVTRYVAELEKFAAKDPADPGAASGQAA
jgi:hypothetical protein